MDWFLFFRNERKSIFHVYTPQHTRIIFAVGWTRERREDFGEQTTEKKNEGLCVLRRAFEREREKLYCRILLDIIWEKAWNLACGSTWKKRNEGKWYRAWRKRRRWWRRWRKTTSTWASACGSQICWISARARTRKRQRWRIRLTFTCKGWRGWRKLRDERFYIEREIERNRNSETLETRRVQQREGYSCDVGNY